MSKNIILNSLKESFVSISKNKSLFFLLFVLQIVFFVIFSFINYHYQARIIESSNAIFEYLGKQQLDEVSISENLLQQRSILGDDPLMISRNFNDILKNFRIYLFYVFILLIVFVSMSWTLTNNLTNKINFKHLIKIFLNNLIVLLFYLGLIFGFFFSLLNISIMQVASESSKFFIKYVVFLIFSIILSYFMFISLSLTNKTQLKNIVQKTLIIGIKKAHYISAVYLINILLFGISAFLLYYFLERNPFVLTLAILLLIFSFVFGRILIVKVVEKLE